MVRAVSGGARRPWFNPIYFHRFKVFGENLLILNCLVSAHSDRNEKITFALLLGAMSGLKKAQSSNFKITSQLCMHH